MIPYVVSATVNGLFVRNRGDAGYGSKTESGTLSGGTMELDEIVAPDTEVTVTIAGDPAEVLPWSYVPNAGEIALDRTRGLFKYNVAADDGKAVSFTYNAAGTVVTAGKWDTVFSAVDPSSLLDLTDVPDTYGTAGQALVVNAGADGLEWADAAGGGGGVGVAGFSREFYIAGTPEAAAKLGSIWVPGLGDSARTVTHLSISAGVLFGLAGSGVTEIYVTDQATATGGVSVSLPVTGTTDWATATVSLAVDTSTGGGKKLNVFCVTSAGHGNMNLGLVIE